MTRAIHACLSGFVIMTVVLLGSVAHAGPKQKMAVLGIEAVIGANGQIDPADVQFAKDLTRELRSRVNNSSMYELTKDQRELSDEKLMNNCGAEHPTCMAPIGASIGADVMLFGKVENAKGGYKVTLKLVSVAKKQHLASDPNAFIAAADTKGVGLANWVRDHYRKLTGESANGTLVVTVPGEVSGKVLVNGEPKETLKSGSATLSLPEGRYRIGVDADGFRLWEQEGVTVSADKPTDLRPDLRKQGGEGEGGGTTTVTTTGTESLSKEGVVSTKSNKTVWKVAAGVGLGGAVIGGAVMIWQWRVMKRYDSHGELAAGAKFEFDDTSRMPLEAGKVDQSLCGKGKITGDSSGASKFEDACDAKGRMPILGAVTGGLAALGAGALIYVMVSKDGTEEAPAGVSGRRAKKRKKFAVTPIVTPDGTGATLRFDW